MNELLLDELVKMHRCTDQDYIDYFLAVKRERQLMDELNKIQAKRIKIGGKILSAWKRADKRKTTLLNGATIYAKTETLVLPIFDEITSCQALENAGYGELVSKTYDKRELRRQIQKEGELPPDLEPYFNVWQKENLICRCPK